LVFIEFIYNNLQYLIIRVSLFYTLYGFYLIIEINTKDNVLKREVLVIIKRIKKIQEEKQILKE
jgi:hypothetical protein